MKAYLAEVNTTPGDFEINYLRICHEIQIANKYDDVDVIVFPELTICGYLTRDLLYLDGFINNNIKYLKKITEFGVIRSNLTIIVGYADRNYKEYGKPFRNMAAVIRGGVVIATYQKQLLPFYDVFDEPRYYEPGQELCKINIAGKNCGITICEDLWNDKGQDDYYYVNNPVERYLRSGVDVIINLSASPYYCGKVKQRADMAKAVTRGGLPGHSYEASTLIYVNQIGGQDELVFDGNSIVANNGKIIHMGGGIVDTDSRELSDNAERTVMASGTIEELINNIIRGLYDYVTKTGHEDVVINSSGGVDSAVVIALAVETFGAHHVHCIMMPSKYSSKESVADAKALHAKFNVNEYEVKIDHDPILSAVRHSFKPNYPHKSSLHEFCALDFEERPVAEENIQARMRGLMGAMFFSNAFGAMPLTTGNKTELALGYCTLYGDMSGGFNPIGDLYKDQVVEIGKFLGVPKEILNKAPSAELRPDQVDETSLLPYKWLNSIVRAFIEDYVSDYNCWLKWDGRINMLNPEVTDDEYYRMIKLIKLNEFKRRQAAPCVKVSKVAFGMGRRMPLVSCF